MKLKILLAAGFLFAALIAMPIYASGGNCPAFTSSMIDAAFLAMDYSQQDPPGGAAEDSPMDASIVCYLANDAGGGLLVEVLPGEAQLIGFSSDDLAPGADYATQLRTKVFNLTWAEQQACRAQVLGSFVWKQYCKPLPFPD